MNAVQLNRWNILLGQSACEGGERTGDLSAVLDFVYGAGDLARGDLSGGREASRLTVPDWVAAAQSLLPPRAFDTIARHAVEKYRKTELLTEDAVLENVKPDIDILKDVLTFKSVLSPDKMQKVKALVRRVAQELSDKMKQEVSSALFGPATGREHSPRGDFRSLDIEATIRANLKTWDPVSKRLCPDRLLFFRKQKAASKKRLILLVDESGSMLDSVINTALLAGILSQTRFLDVSVAVFDTAVVDLTDRCNDVTELLFSVQLGGGTDIAKALSYAASLIVEPRQTLVVLISDLFDGFGYKKMYAAAQSILAGGSKLLALTALDHNTGRAVYDADAAEHLARLGCQVAAKTPGELCEWIVKVG